jgi:hypothetical protein
VIADVAETTVAMASETEAVAWQQWKHKQGHDGNGNRGSGGENIEVAEPVA